MSIHGGPLKPGVANQQHQKFITDVLKKIDPAIAAVFPEAICYSLGELREFIDNAEKNLIAAGVNYNERGIAIILGISSGIRQHTDNRVTAMLVATQFTEDAVTGTVTTISNPTNGPHKREALRSVERTDTPIDDFAYDTGSMWP